MTATATMIARLRRMVNEPDDTNGYTDALLAGAIETYPLLDSDGNDPSVTAWTATYCLHSAAREIWEEKASVVAVDFDFSADGGSYSRSQVYQQYMNRAAYHGARRAVDSIRLVSTPTEPVPAVWIGNLPETD